MTPELLVRAMGRWSFRLLSREGRGEDLASEGPLGARLWASLDVQEICQRAGGCMGVEGKGVDEARFICESSAHT